MRRLLSIVDPPPPGFEFLPEPSQRDFRSGAFALFSGSIDDAMRLLGGLKGKVTGIVATPSADFTWEPISRFLFHAGVPSSLMPVIAGLGTACLSVLEAASRTEDERRKIALEFERAVGDRHRLASDFALIRKNLLEEIAERRTAEEASRISEERYRLVVDNASDAILIAQDGRVIFSNPLLSELSGFPADEIARRQFVDFIHPEDRAMVAERHFRRLHGEEPPSRYAFRILTKSGAPLWMEIGSVLISWEGRPATLNFLRDVTRQKKLETQLLHAQKMEAVGTLAGGIAHDFNNLLQAISGCATLALQETPEGSGSRDFLRSIEKATDRGAELVRRLMTFSRRNPPEKRQLDLNDEVFRAVCLIERIIPKMVRIETRLGKELGPIEGDPTQIEQIVMNLGANAKDAMPEGGLLIFETGNSEVTAADALRLPEVPPGRYAVLRVRDTGTGMSPETLCRIFDPFFTTKEVGAGTGLGLATVYGIVRSHGGRIRCESNPGKGTCFEIFLPSMMLPPSAGKLHERKPIPPIITGAPEGSETILHVDDEDVIRDLAKTILQKLGYEVLGARSGEEALDIFLKEKNRPDLVVLDLGKPGKGGRRFLSELRKHDPHVKVLVASGYSEEQQAAGIIDAGAQGFISKPFKPSDLAHAIRNILDGSPGPTAT